MSDHDSADRVIVTRKGSGGRFIASLDTREKAAGRLARELRELFGEADPKPERIKPLDPTQQERCTGNLVARTRQEMERRHARNEERRNASRLITQIYRDVHLVCMVCGAEMTARRSTKTTCSARCRKQLSRRAKREALPSACRVAGASKSKSDCTGLSNETPWGCSPGVGGCLAKGTC